MIRGMRTRADLRCLLVLAVLPAWACDCAEGNKIGRVVPQIEVTPSSLEFGEVPTGAVRYLSVKVKNIGTGRLTIQAVDAMMPFTASALSISVEAGLSTEIDVAFAPVDAMDYAGTLSIVSDAENNPTLLVGLSGKGVAGFVDVSPRNVDFGTVTVGASKSAELVITNRGIEPVAGNVSPERFLRPEQFQLTGLASFASPGPYAVAQRGQTNLDLQYRPLALGTDRGRIIFETCGARCGVEVTVTATAAESTVRLDPSSLDFGDVGIAGMKSLALTVLNEGSLPIDVTEVLVSGTTELSVTSARPLPQTLAPGSSLALAAVYRPTAATAMRGTVTVKTTDRGVPRVSAPASGNGVGPHFDVSPPAIQFGAQVQAIKHRRSLLLANSGSSEVLVTGITISGDPSFGLEGVQGLPVRLGGGETFTPQVTFTPTGVLGTFTATVHVTTNDPMSAAVDIPVSGGFNMQACDLDVQPSRVNFGLVLPPGRRTLSATLRNRGQQLCTFTRGGFRAPPDPAVTAAAVTYPFTLAPGASTSLEFTFAPTDNREVKVTYDLKTDEAVFSEHPINIVGSSKSYDDLFVRPEFVDFGQVTPNCVRSGVAVTLFNGGTQAATVDRTTLTTTTAELSATLINSISVPAGGSVDVPLRYAPIDYGIDTAVLEIAVANRPYNFIVPIQGQGAEQPIVTDRFTQTAARDVDVLFVIDNSCSMGDDQANLAANISTFIANAAIRSVDFRIAITTTDVTSVATAGVFRGPIMSPATPNLVAEFQRQAAVGVMGSGIEQGLEAMDSVFHNLGGHTPDFLRRNAGFVVVIISDEEDSSPASTVFYFTELQRYAPTGYLTAVVSGEATGCVSPMLLGAAAPAPKYMDFLRLTQGTSLSICTDWATTLQTLGAIAFGLRSSFPLTQRLDTSGTLRVEIDGVLVPLGDYTVDVAGNAIVFATPPPERATVSITYAAGC